MHARKKGIARRLIPLVLLISFASVASLYPQFLEDEEEKAPDDIARSIKAEPSSRTPDGKCVIKVTWQINPRFTAGDYVVAKSDGMIDTVDKVRAARVIATVKGAEKNTYEDADCTPGSYYYVVLSKKSIVENRMGLFRDGNYTAVPAIISASNDEVLVTGIKADEIEKFKVRLTWIKPEKTGIFYYVYRSKDVINSKSRLSGADKLGTVADAGEFLDEGITQPGDYYYAVTARALKGKENQNLVPNGNFTTRGLPVRLSVPAPERVAVTSIDARAERGSVLVQWSFTGKGEGSMHRLFRSAKPLKTAGEVSDGEIIQKIDMSP